MSCHQVLGQSQQRLVAAVRTDQAESDRQTVHPRDWQRDLRSKHENLEKRHAGNAHDACRRATGTLRNRHIRLSTLDCL